MLPETLKVNFNVQKNICIRISTNVSNNIINCIIYSNRSYLYNLCAATIASFADAFRPRDLTTTFILQLSLGYMIKDIVKFMVIFIVVVLAFATGLYTLYHQYKGLSRIENGDVIKQDTAFDSLVLLLHLINVCFAQQPFTTSHIYLKLL